MGRQKLFPVIIPVETFRLLYRILFRTSANPYQTISETPSTEKATPDRSIEVSQ